MNHPLPDASFKRLPFVYLLMPLVAGILSYSQWPTIDFFPAFLFLLGLWAITCMLIFLRRFRNGYTTLSAVLLFGLLFLSGLLLCNQKDVTKQKYWFGNTVSDATVYWAKVASTPETKAKTIQLELDVKRARRGNQWENTSGKIIAYLSKKNFNGTIAKGDFILFPNKLTKITNRGNPFEFNYAGLSQPPGHLLSGIFSPEGN